MSSEKTLAPEGYLPVPTTSPTKTTGPIALDEDEVGSVQPRARCSRAKKLAGLAVLAFLFVTFKHGVGIGGHGLRGLFSGEFREGLGYLRGGGLDLHWEDEAEDDNEPFFNLPTTSASFSEDGTTTLVVPAHAREIALLFDDGVDATLHFATSDSLDDTSAAQIYVEAIPSGHVDNRAEDEDEDDDDDDGTAVQVFDAGSGVSGLVFDDSASAYIVTVTLPSKQKAGRPLSLTAHGESLSIPAIDLKGLHFDKFSLSSSPDESITIKDLHANEGKIVVTAGDIVGSFNVSRELILRTTIGAIQANVSIHEPHHKRQTHKLKEIESRHSHHHPHDGPPGLVKVFAKTNIGAVDVLFTDRKISNSTNLVTKAVSSIGAVRVGVVPGFKGMFVEGAKIGEVEYANVANETIKIIKEVHNGPGGFIKGFVGPPPPHHRPHGCPGKDKKHKKHGHHDKDDKHPHPKRDMIEAEQEDDDDEPRFWTQDENDVADEQDHEDEDDEDEADEDSDDEDETAPRHPHKRPPPPGKGDHHRHHGPPPPGRPSPPRGPPPPHGPPHHDGPPHHRGPPHHGGPPPGYGFVGAFASTGKVDIVFL